MYPEDGNSVIFAIDLGLLSEFHVIGGWYLFC